MKQDPETTLEYQLDGLIADGWIEAVDSRLRSGKEGTVYCCVAGERARAVGYGYLVVKVYR
ncbi:MAG TPA: hypothetical protein VKU87_04080, partial [Thermomicrobiaceae bacterium]|nr:hypothetical protein [Thermomicrobiaceae bacterium]